MRKFFLLILVFALPQFALACGLSEPGIPLIDIGMLTVLSSIAFAWLFLFLKNDFGESSWQKVFLSVSKGGLKGILIVSLFYSAGIWISASPCLQSPRESHFEALPLYVLIVSTVFFLLQRKWLTNTRRHALLWSFFFGTIVMLYMYGFTMSESTTFALPPFLPLP